MLSNRQHWMIRMLQGARHPASAKRTDFAHSVGKGNLYAVWVVKNVAYNKITHVWCSLKTTLSFSAILGYGRYADGRWNVRKRKLKRPVRDSTKMLSRIKAGRSSSEPGKNKTRKVLTLPTKNWHILVKMKLSRANEYVDLVHSHLLRIKCGLKDTKDPELTWNYRNRLSADIQASTCGMILPIPAW